MERLYRVEHETCYVHADRATTSQHVACLRPRQLERQRVLWHELVVTQNGRPVNPDSVNWSSVDIRQFQFTQPPSGKNVLGIVKFRFPNKFDVYMHDTPDRHLFKQDIRAFSSGCIRLERPLDMVEYVLRGNRGWDRAAIEEASKKRGTRTLNVDVPVNVQSIYMTAIPTAEGTMQFRDDLYGLDRYFLDAQKKRTDTVVAERTQQRRVASLAR